MINEDSERVDIQLWTVDHLYKAYLQRHAMFRCVRFSQPRSQASSLQICISVLAPALIEKEASDDAESLNDSCKLETSPASRAS